jgi:FkbM family methyltransferase
LTFWGGRFVCDLRDLVQSRIYYFGAWEPNLTAYIRGALRSGDVMVDVGANIGYYSVLASQLVGASGRVVSIEASPRVFALLSEHLALNGATNVRAVNAAVSDAEGKLAIYAGPPDNVGATSSRADWYGGATFEAEVPTAPLARLLEASELARVRLLKIDVEGAELPVLLNLLDNLDEFSPEMEIVVEVSPIGLREAGTSFEALVERFADRGFTWYVIENDYELAAYLDLTPRPPIRGTTTPTGQFDVLFARRLD